MGRGRRHGRQLQPGRRRLAATWPTMPHVARCGAPALALLIVCATAAGGWLLREAATCPAPASDHSAAQLRCRRGQAVAAASGPLRDPASGMRVPPLAHSCAAGCRLQNPACRLRICRTYRSTYILHGKEQSKQGSHRASRHRTARLAGRAAAVRIRARGALSVGVVRGRGPLRRPGTHQCAGHEGGGRGAALARRHGSSQQQRVLCVYRRDRKGVS